MQVRLLAFRRLALASGSLVLAALMPFSAPRPRPWVGLEPSLAADRSLPLPPRTHDALNQEIPATSGRRQASSSSPTRHRWSLMNFFAVVPGRGAVCWPALTEGARNDQH